MIPAGVTVLYGPSRIGKTSIMNWVRNIFAVSQGMLLVLVLVEKEEWVKKAIIKRIL